MNLVRRAALAAALVVASLPALALAAAKTQVDLIIQGGTVLTMAGPAIENGSVAVSKGEIVAVGPAAEIDAAYTATDTISGKGKAVLPGFVNAHTHAPMVLFRGIADDRDLMDWLVNYIFPAEAKNVDRDFVKVGTRLAAAEMILSGTTTYADMYYYESDMAEETKAAGLRGVLGETVIDFPAPDNKTWDDAIKYVREYGKKWKGDPLITAAIAPHAPYTVSEAHLKQVRALATELGMPILIHVAETTKEQEDVSKAHGGLTPVAYLDSIGFLGDDVVGAHSIWLSKEEMAIYAKRKTGAAHCPESNMMLASGVAQVPDMRAAGVEVGLGTDGPAGSNNNLDMFEEMASAARLQKISRKDPKALTAHDVLTMATIEGAKVLGLASKIGSLEKGKRADIIVVNLDLPNVQPIYSVESAIVYAATGADVVATIVDGKVLMTDRKLRTIDLPATIAAANAMKNKVVASLKKN